MNRKWPNEDALGFGYGDHRCIAETLAKTELATVFCKCKTTPVYGNYMLISVYSYTF